MPESESRQREAYNAGLVVLPFCNLNRLREVEVVCQTWVMIKVCANGTKTAMDDTMTTESVPLRPKPYGVNVTGAKGGVCQARVTLQNPKQLFVNNRIHVA
jgi:hypothetical protein